MDSQERAVRAAQDRLLTGGSASGVRPEVAGSWDRCVALGVDPEADGPPVDLSDGELDAYRDAHPLAPAMPVIRRLLVEHATAEDLIVAVSDAEGRLLWVEGAPAVRSAAEAMRFTAGARWDEGHAGTNAPALALTLDTGVRISAAEHWARTVRPWSCAAVPLHHPATGLLLGALDVTGDSRASTAGTLALVRATAAAVEREILLQHRGLRGLSAARRLELLGASQPTWDGVPLSLRHAELLTLLLEHPEGLATRDVAVLLADRDLDPVTVRAELSRLRRVVGPDVVGARPYRLLARVDTDAGQVRRALDDGRLATALEAYVGPLLPRSSAPGIVELRDALAWELRAAVIASRSPASLERWTASPWAVDDLEAWRVCAAVLPAGPHRGRVAAHARRLDLLQGR
jgi:hypothetical protein